MSSVRSTNGSAGNSKRETPQGMHEFAPVHYPRKRCENWPFRIYQEGGTIYQNIPPRKSKVDLSNVEEAPW